MSFPKDECQKPNLASLMDQMEEVLRPTLRLLLPTLGYKTTLDFVKYLVAGVVRDLYRGGLTQQRLAEDLQTTRVTIGGLINDKELKSRPAPEKHSPPTLVLVVAILGAQSRPMTLEEVVHGVRPLFPSARSEDLNRWVFEALNIAVGEGLAKIVQKDDRMAFQVGPSGPNIKLRLDTATAIDLASSRVPRHLEFQREHAENRGAGPRATLGFKMTLTPPLALEFLRELQCSINDLMRSYEARALAELALGDDRRTIRNDEARRPYELELFVVASNAELSPLGACKSDQE